MVGTIIVAAGTSSRMNGVNKLLEDINGKCVLAMTLENFENCSEVDYIVVVTRVDMMNEVNKIIKENKFNKILKVVEGGKTRQESVKNGISVCPKETSIIAIHDGARPFTDINDIKNVIFDCRKYGASILGVKVKDTVKIVKDGFINETPNRDDLFNAQTPQVFNFSLYNKALENAEKKGLSFTDDSQLFESIGEKVYITLGSYKNIKITTLEDIEIAKAFSLNFKNN